MMRVRTLLDDLREAARRIRRNPRTSLLAMTTLATGIGLAAAVFSLSYAFLLAPPPFAEPDRLVFLSLRSPTGGVGIGAVDLQDWQEGANAFESVALSEYAEYSWTGQSLSGFEGAEVLRGRVVSDTYFATLRGPMALGRGFLPGEGEPGRNDVVVLSYGLWERRFGRRPDVIGQTLSLNGRNYRIAGVAGADFRTYEVSPYMMYGYEVQAWTPFSHAGHRRGNRMYYGIGRLKPGLTVEALKGRVDAIQARLAKQFRENEGEVADILPLSQVVGRQVRPALIALVAAVLCLVLITGANVASLLLARAAGQGREMAIRTALGASRGRLYRMVLAESVVLALVAGLGGALVAAWALMGFRALLPLSFRLGWAFEFGPRVVLAALLVAGFAGLLAGLAPAFESCRGAAGGLAAGALQSTPRRSRLLQGIVVSEIALAVLLSISAGLCTKAFVSLLRTQLGYETDNLLAMRIRLQEQRYREKSNRVAYWDDLLGRVRALPGVQAAAAVSTLPMGYAYMSDWFWVEGRPEPPRGQWPMANIRAITPNYFSALGIPLLEGRAFEDSDGPAGERVAIVNDLLAEKFWPGRSAVGQYLRWDKPVRVVGVVRRVRHAGPTDKYEFEMYLSYRQWMPDMVFLVAKARREPESLIAPIRHELRAVDPNVPAFEIRTMKQALSNELALPRLPMALMGVFAAVAALLAALGLFGVIAYWVGQRTREMGVRAALGATARDLRAMVLRQGGRLALAGVGIGLGGALATMRFLRSLLYGVNARDPAIYALVAVAAMLVTAATCLAPADRAARIEPAAALRHE